MSDTHDQRDAGKSPNTERDAIGSTPTSNMNSKTLGKRKNYKERSGVWAHFTKFTNSEGIQRTKCNYCPNDLCGDTKISGTSSLWAHFKRCEGNPSKNQSHLAFTTSKDDKTGETKVSLQAIKFEQQKGRKAIAEMLIIDELPFKFVENEGFRKCMRICQPALVLPSRSTVTRDCYKVYLGEKAKFKAQLQKSTLRVCLTTDTWTSIQRMNYMCLTAHYIDENWKLQKKILNFCTISSHRGADIGRAVENCLLEWNLCNILTITVDNASSNDVAVAYLINKMVKWGDHCILQGKWTHVRCLAHIMNLVVQDGLKEIGQSVDRIRTAIRWIRHSGARVKRFKEFVILEKIDCEKPLCLDTPTRLNSTYVMLSVAIEYEKVFDRFADEDVVYDRDLKEGPGVPVLVDWTNARRLTIFLRHFYELTIRVSGTKYITSNTYLDSINCMDSVLKRCYLGDDEELRQMALSMMIKFDKYWGDIKKFNLLVFIASLYPRTKMWYLRVTLNSLYGQVDGDTIWKLCDETLRDIFNDYKRIYSNQHVKKGSSSSFYGTSDCSLAGNATVDGGFFDSSVDSITAVRERTMAEAKRRKAESGEFEDSKNELERYLMEEIEGDDAWFKSSDFTVLGWWQRRSAAFPILSLLARDILAIPISTVASESTFSTGGRVLDTFRSSLTPQTVEALICCQDWIRSSDIPVNVEERIEDLEKFEEEMRRISIN